jgi:periplasmic divalent cation tolerance protein
MCLGGREKQPRVTKIALIYAVFPTADEADDISAALLSERLAACANRHAAVISHFRWAGAVQNATEYPVIFKTSTEKASAAMARIAELHSYDVPAILQLGDATALPPFAQWVSSETS